MAACRCTAGSRKSNTKANLVYLVRRKGAAVGEVAERRIRKLGMVLAQPAHKPGMWVCWQRRRLRMAASHKFAVGLLLPVL